MCSAGKYDGGLQLSGKRAPGVPEEAIKTGRQARLKGKPSKRGGFARQLGPSLSGLLKEIEWEEQIGASIICWRSTFRKGGEKKGR